MSVMSELHAREQEARNLIGADMLEYEISYLKEVNAELQAKVDAFEQVERDRRQLRAYRVAEKHDDFYGQDYRRWADARDSETLAYRMEVER